MHLPLDKLIIKKVNGVTRQIYMDLILYLIFYLNLELMDIPVLFGCILLEKLRYLQL